MDPPADAALDRTLDALGGEALEGLIESTVGRRFPGIAVVRQFTCTMLHLNPATLDAKATPVAKALVAHGGPWIARTFNALEYARSEDLHAMVARIRATPVPRGSWEQNALSSAPKLVARVAKATNLSREASALYLQYLALLWPTPKNVLKYNGWTAKELEAAHVELAKKKLIFEAKRERAGRSYFLPGGWEALKAPHPPMESWKVSLYGTRTGAGAPEPQLHRFLALAPFHLLFERAFSRIEGGDVPRYEEVKR
jgi:hypothetical protein